MSHKEEIANEYRYILDESKIKNEEQFDGFYCAATNLEDCAEDILKINKRRWEIEESFRIVKSEFKARPVYLSRDDRIKAHSMVCFLALSLFRQLEKRVNEQFTACELIETLHNMKFCAIPREGYIPAYKRTAIYFGYSP